jgi:hypothetical protein
VTAASQRGLCYHIAASTGFGGGRGHWVSRGRAAKQAHWLIVAALTQAEPRNLAKTNASVDMRADRRHPISTVASAG